MSRHLFALLLLAATVSAQAVTPARQGANSGGGTCPESDASTAVEEAAATEPAPPAAKPAAPAEAAKGGGGSIARPKPGARWHSFLPGMFK